MRCNEWCFNHRCNNHCSGYECEMPKIYPPHLPICPSFIQLWDRSYMNELKVNSPLNLSNEGINPLFTTGGYKLETTSITNDTLKFPKPGIYHIEISLRTSFSFNLDPPPMFGLVYPISFDIVQTDNKNLGSMVFTGIIPNDINVVLDTTLTTQFLLSVTDINVGVRILLSNFNFNLASEGKLDVFDIIIIAKRWE